MKSKRVPFKIGCDPELFLADKTGKLRASCGLIGGTKIAPQPLPDLGAGYAVQEDNVAIEFNVPPAKSAREFVHSVSRTLKYLGDGVNSMYEFHIVPLASASFPQDELVAEAALVFGCDPDFNAWTGEKNPRPDAEDKTLRSCGGHIHIGFDKSLLDGRQLIKCMDAMIGVPSVIMDASDESVRRRLLYGKRGAYREKEYGFEYRTPSNFWVFKPESIDWVYRNADRAVQAAASQFAVDDYKDAIEQAIDYNNKDAAMFLINELNLEVLHA